MNTRVNPDAHKANMVATPKNILFYNEVKEYARKNGIRSMRMWFDFHNVRKGGQVRPYNIPGDPSKYFARRNLWTSWGDFLGTKTVASNVKKEQFVDLETCKQWFTDNKIYSVTKFRELLKDGQRPTDIPSAPDKKYGVRFAELLCPKYLPFEEAKALIQQYKLTDYREYRRIRKEKIDELSCLPCNPDKIYGKTKEWRSWPDFLGYSRLQAK